MGEALLLRQCQVILGLPHPGGCQHGGVDRFLDLVAGVDGAPVIDCTTDEGHHNQGGERKENADAARLVLAERESCPVLGSGCRALDETRHENASCELYVMFADNAAQLFRRSKKDAG